MPCREACMLYNTQGPRATQMSSLHPLRALFEYAVAWVVGFGTARGLSLTRGGEPLVQPCIHLELYWNRMERDQSAMFSCAKLDQRYWCAGPLQIV